MKACDTSEVSPAHQPPSTNAGGEGDPGRRNGACAAPDFRPRTRRPQLQGKITNDRSGSNVVGVALRGSPRPRRRTCQPAYLRAVNGTKRWAGKGCGRATLRVHVNVPSAWTRTYRRYM